jgi:hypothetical protein
VQRVARGGPSGPGVLDQEAKASTTSAVELIVTMFVSA